MPATPDGRPERFAPRESLQPKLSNISGGSLTHSLRSSCSPSSLCVPSVSLSVARPGPSFRGCNGGNEFPTWEFAPNTRGRLHLMSTTHDGPDAPDAQRIEHDIHHAVKRCRMVVRKVGNCLSLPRPSACLSSLPMNCIESRGLNQAFTHLVYWRRHGRKQRLPEPPLEPLAGVAEREARCRGVLKCPWSCGIFRRRRTRRRARICPPKARQPFSVATSCASKGRSCGSRAAMPASHSTASSNTPSCFAKCRGRANSIPVPAPGSRLPAAEPIRAQDGRAVDGAGAVAPRSDRWLERFGRDFHQRLGARFDLPPQRRRQRQLALGVKARGNQLVLVECLVLGAVVSSARSTAAAILSHIQPSDTRPIRSM